MLRHGKTSCRLGHPDVAKVKPTTVPIWKVHMDGSSERTELPYGNLEIGDVFHSAMVISRELAALEMMDGFGRTQFRNLCASRRKLAAVIEGLFSAAGGLAERLPCRLR